MTTTQTAQAAIATPATLPCTRCNRVLGSFEFPCLVREVARGGRAKWCRSCEREVRQERSARPAAIPAITNTISFGVELETVGIDCQAAALAMQTVLGGEVRYIGGAHSPWACVAPDGRKWLAMQDGSLSGGYAGSAEVVSPILTEADMDALQAVTRALRAAGAKVDSSCGMHVHVGLKNGAGEEVLKPAHVAELVRHSVKVEPALRCALAILPRRLDWCKPIPAGAVSAMPKGGRVTDRQLASAWYNNVAGRDYNNSRSISARQQHHYDGSRYHGINVHAVWNKGTVEFRYFNGTLHAGKVKAAVQLCLGLVRATATKTEPDQAFTADLTGVQALIAHCDLTQDAHATARHHLLGSLVAGDDAGVQ